MHIWEKEEKKFLLAIKDTIIPNEKLEDVEFVKLSQSSDFEKIPSGGGCYWIWTNEPIFHSFHKENFPERFESGEIIYNGFTKNSINSRLTNHLLSSEDEGRSGISIDIYLKDHQGSHRKKAMSEVKRSKVPYIEYIPIRKKEQLMNLNLSDLELEFVKNQNYPNFYFRNGINIFDDKHKNFEYRVYFLAQLNLLYLEYIEKKWREKHRPRLCSYITGR